MQRAHEEHGRSRRSRRALSAAVGALLLPLTLLAVASPGASAAERGFELVTPAGSTANIRVAGGITSADGNTVCYSTDQTLLGSVVNGIGFVDDAFCAYRGASGWESKWLSGPQAEGELGGIGSRVWYLSDDGRKALMGGTALISGFPDWLMNPEDPEELPSANVTPNFSGFLYEDGGLTWLNQRPSPLAQDWGGAPLAATDSLDHAIFTSSRALLPQDSTESLDPDAIYPPQDVYLWTRDGLKLVSVDEDGTDIGDARLAQLNAGTARPGTLSRDGSRAFFISRAGVYGAPPFADSIFRWEDGEVVHVSPRRGPDGTIPLDVAFVGASADGDVAYLMSVEQLTSEPLQPGFTPALYRYTVSTDELELVVTDPGFVAPVGFSDDGSTVVYTRANTLYVNRDDVETEITPLAIPGDLMPHRLGSGIEGTRPLRMSEDGRKVLYASEAQTPGVAQVFLWEEGVGVTRVSSSSNGDAAQSHATFGNYADLMGTGSETSDFDQHWQWGNRGAAWTDDHETVYFQTADALVAEDENEVSDVYEWRDGAVSLVTPGTPGGSGFYYFASTPDGSTVFFITYRRVLPASDRNVVRDVYAARVGGGGFPEPPPDDFGNPSPPAERGPAPPGPDVGSSAPRTGEQATQGAQLKTRKLSASATRALARRGRVGIAVAGAEGDRVRVRAVAKVGGKARTVGSATKRLKAGSNRVTLRLSKAARARLSSKRRLAVTLVVSGGEYTARRVTVTLRLPAVDSRKRG